MRDGETVRVRTSEVMNVSRLSLCAPRQSSLVLSRAEHGYRTALSNETTKQVELIVGPLAAVHPARGAKLKG